MRIFLYTGIILLGVTGLSACSSNDGNPGNARVRLLNVSPGHDSVDLFVQTEDDDDDESLIEGVAVGTISQYAELNSDIYDVIFRPNAVSTTLLTLSDQSLTEDSHRTYVAYGSTGRFSILQLEEDQDEPDSGESKVNIVNTSEAGSLDVYITESFVSLDDVSPTATVSSGGGASTTIDSGTYRLRVTGSGDEDDVRLDLSDVAFDSEQITSVILAATEGGVLVDALFLPQQGELSTIANPNARIRGAVGIADGTAVTVRVGGVALLTNAASGIIDRSYKLIDAGNAEIDLSVDGAPVEVGNESLSAGSDYTLLVWDDADGTHATLLVDDNRLPTATGKAKLRLLNGMSGLGEPITLAVDYFPVAEFVPLGQASEYSQEDGGLDHRLDVSNSNTTVNVHTQDEISLVTSGVYTMFLSGGGDRSVVGVLRRDR